MKTRSLGRTGMQVSPYCLGTMMFGPAGNPDQDDCVRIVHRALDGGINFIDTADVYGGGETERIVGKAIEGRRDDIVLATKFSGPMGEDANQRGASRRWIMSAVEGSLRRLGVDHIDLYQIHHFDPRTDLEEALSALSDLIRSGKVRVIGSDPQKFAAVEALAPIADAAGISLTHMAMAFVVAHPQVSSAIIGPRTMQHLDDLLSGAATALDDDVLDRIDSVAAPGTDTRVTDVGYRPESIGIAALRRRQSSERSAA